MDENRIKVALIGLGHLGKIHLKCMKESELIDLVGVWDIDKELQQKISDDEKIEYFNKVDHLLEQVHAVIIVSPTSTHAAWAQKCLEFNRHFFVEKPVTATVEEANLLYHQALNRNLKIQVGHVERFNPAYTVVKDHIGEPMFIEGHRLAEFKPRGTDVSVVMDLMIHDIDLVLNMVKHPIKEIRASGVAIMSPTPDICNARLEFGNGATANLTASRISMKQMRKLRVFQSGQYISMDLLKKETQIVKISEDPTANHPFSWPLDTLNGKKYIQVDMPEPPLNNAILDELNCFASSVLHDTIPPVTLDHGVNALKVAQQIQDQMELKKTI